MYTFPPAAAHPFLPLSQVLQPLLSLLFLPLVQQQQQQNGQNLLMDGFLAFVSTLLWVPPWIWSLRPDPFLRHRFLEVHCVCSMDSSQSALQYLLHVPMPPLCARRQLRHYKHFGFWFNCKIYFEYWVRFSSKDDSPTHLSLFALNISSTDQPAFFLGFLFDHLPFRGSLAVRSPSPKILTNY